MLIHNPVSKTPSPPMRPNASDEEKARWFAAARLEATQKGIPFGKVAWLYRILYGQSPSERIKKLAKSF